jgi:hypothetical protein
LSPGAPDDEPKCAWCEEPLGSGRDYCSKRCRQSAWRLRQRLVRQGADGRPRRLGYADPPYPGHAGIYRGHPDYAGEVDHRALVRDLVERFDGWALSTSSRSLRDLLPLCPEGVHVCAWVKPIGVSRHSFGAVVTWEPVIVFPARELRPAVRDWVRCHPARRGGDLPGRKPAAFCAALFSWLGASPVDTLADLFPGSGMVGRCWRVFCRQTPDPVRRSLRVSPGAGADAASRRPNTPEPSPVTRGDQLPLFRAHSGPVFKQPR